VTVCFVRAFPLCSILSQQDVDPILLSVMACILKQFKTVLRV